MALVSAAVLGFLAFAACGGDDDDKVAQEPRQDAATTEAPTTTSVTKHELLVTLDWTDPVELIFAVTGPTEPSEAPIMQVDQCHTPGGQSTAHWAPAAPASPTPALPSSRSMKWCW